MNMIILKVNIGLQIVRRKDKKIKQDTNLLKGFLNIPKKWVMYVLSKVLNVNQDT